MTKRELCIGVIIAGLLSLGAGIIVVHPDAKYKKGVVFQSTYISPAGLILKTREEVVSEIKNGTVTTLNIKLTQVDGSRVSEASWTKIYYDNNHWATDVSIGMRPDQVGLEGASIAEFSDSLVYPYTMKIGDTLSTAHAYKKMSLKGNFWEQDNFYYNRKVMERDTIVTPLGRIPTIRIEYKMYGHHYRKSAVLGDKKESDLHYGSVWFSTEYGIVQTEMTNKFGVTKTTLESVK